MDKPLPDEERVEVTASALSTRVATHLPVGLSPLVLAALLGVVSAVASWLTSRCLRTLPANEIREPGVITSRRLERRVVRAIAMSEQVKACGIPTTEFARQHKWHVIQAFTTAGKEATDDEIRAVCQP